MNDSFRKDDGQAPEVELPAPTAWPLVLAFGVALAFAGLATNGLLTVIGAVLSVAGVVGWFGQTFPRSAEVLVRVEPEAFVPRTSRSTIERLPVHGDLGRAQLPLELYPVSAGVRGGLAGAWRWRASPRHGVVSGHGIWYPSISSPPGLPRPPGRVLLSSPPSFLRLRHRADPPVIDPRWGVYGACCPCFRAVHPARWGGRPAPLTGLLHSALGFINRHGARIDWRCSSSRRSASAWWQGSSSEAPALSYAHFRCRPRRVAPACLRATSTEAEAWLG